MLLLLYYCREKEKVKYNVCKITDICFIVFIYFNQNSLNYKDKYSWNHLTTKTKWILLWRPSGERDMWRTWLTHFAHARTRSDVTAERFACAAPPLWRHSKTFCVCCSPTVTSQQNVLRVLPSRHDVTAERVARSPLSLQMSFKEGFTWFPS